MNAQIERRTERKPERRIDWRLVLGFVVALIGATGALVAADISAASTPAVQATQADRLAA